jgi:hypothetical protein
MTKCENHVKVVHIRCQRQAGRQDDVGQLFGTIWLETSAVAP